MIYYCSLESCVFNPGFLIVDSYAQREEARKALSQDENWMNNYVKKILKMLVKQVIVV